MAMYKQTGVSFDRMTALLQGAPPERLTRHAPIYLGEDVPEPDAPVRTDADRLERLDVDGLTYRYPESGRGIEGVGLTVRRGSFTVIAGRIGSGKTTLLRALTGLLRAQVGRGAVERRSGRGPRQLLYTAAHCGHAADPAALQRDVGEQHPDGPAAG
jgi:ATP-binding cassette subfamily B protein